MNQYAGCVLDPRTNKPLSIDFESLQVKYDKAWRQRCFDSDAEFDIYTPGSIWRPAIRNGRHSPERSLAQQADGADGRNCDLSVVRNRMSGLHPRSFTRLSDTDRSHVAIRRRDR